MASRTKTRQKSASKVVKKSPKAVTQLTLPGLSMPDSVILVARRSISANKATPRMKGGYATLWGSKVATKVLQENPKRRYVPATTIRRITNKSEVVEVFPNFEWLGALLVYYVPEAKAVRLIPISCLPDGTILRNDTTETATHVDTVLTGKQLNIPESFVGRFDVLGVALERPSLFKAIATTAQSLLGSNPSPSREFLAWLSNNQTPDLFSLKVPYFAAVLKQSVGSQFETKTKNRAAIFTPARFNHLFCRGAYKNAVITTGFLRAGPVVPVQDVRKLPENEVIRLVNNERLYSASKK